MADKNRDQERKKWRERKKWLNSMNIQWLLFIQPWWSGYPRDFSLRPLTAVSPLETRSACRHREVNDQDAWQITVVILAQCVYQSFHRCLLRAAIHLETLQTLTLALRLSGELVPTAQRCCVSRTRMSPLHALDIYDTWGERVCFFVFKYHWWTTQVKLWKIKPHVNSLWSTSRVE